MTCRLNDTTLMNEYLFFVYIHMSLFTAFFHLFLSLKQLENTKMIELLSQKHIVLETALPVFPDELLNRHSDQNKQKTKISYHIHYSQAIYLLFSTFFPLNV